MREIIVLKKFSGVGSILCMDDGEEFLYEEIAKKS